MPPCALLANGTAVCDAENTANGARRGGGAAPRIIGDRPDGQDARDPYVGQ